MIGIETEYGIYVEGKETQDLVAEATHLVKVYPGPVATGWDYKHEHPRRDMRGFTVDHLSIDPTDAQFEQSESSALHGCRGARGPGAAVRGAALQRPRPPGVFDAGVYEPPRTHRARPGGRAGDADLRRERMQRLGAGRFVALYKNNTDLHGASYGCHESYLTRREVPFEALLHTMLPFLVTRQIFAGAGKVGIEQPQSGVGTVVGRGLSVVAAVGLFYDDRVGRYAVQPADREHAGRAAHRPAHVPAVPRDLRRCQLLRGGDVFESGYNASGAAPAGVGVASGRDVTAGPGLGHQVDLARSRR